MSSDAELNRLIKLFEGAERHLAREVERAIERGNDYTAAMREAKRQEAHGVLQSLRTLAQEGRPDSTNPGPAWNLVADAYREGARGAGRDLATAFTLADQHAAEVVYANFSNQLDDGISMVGRRVDDAFRRATLAETLSGIIEGRGRRDISAGIAQGLRELGLTAFTDAGGRNWNLSDYARMAARTARTEASSLGALNRLASSGVSIVQIINQDACDVCAPYVGEYSIGGVDEGYPALVDIPPFHPNCRCVIAAATETTDPLADFAENEPLLDDDPFADEFLDDEDFLDDDIDPEELERRKYEEGVLRGMEKDENSRLYETIMDNGGIRTGDELREEYREIPNTFKRKDGMRGDEMADMLATYHPEYGIETEDDLIEFFRWR